MVLTGSGARRSRPAVILKERNGMSNEQWRHQHHLIEDMFEALWNFPVPIIAAVEGFAYAGGCELALGTDFIIASETAEFAVKEITRGIMPGGGGIHRLARSIGVRRANEMILHRTGDQGGSGVRLGAGQSRSARRQRAGVSRSKLRKR